MCLIVHACDISHPAKPFELHEKWTYQVLEEFFRQGDLEQSMGLPYSPLCDRNTTHVAESQIGVNVSLFSYAFHHIGFIDFIVEPTMAVCGDMLVKMIEPLVTMPANTNNSLAVNGHLDNDGSSSSGLLSPAPYEM